MDDIVRQFKGVSDGLMKKVVGPNSPSESSASVANRSVTFKTDAPTDLVTKQTTSDLGNSFSENEEGEKDGTFHLEEVESANERNLDSKGVVKSDEQNRNSSEVRSEILSMAANFPSTSGLKEDPLGVPAEVNCKFPSASDYPFNHLQFVCLVGLLN